MNVYKYELEVADRQTIFMHRVLKILDVQVQHGKICVWAVVNPEQRGVVSHEFIVAGTGHPLPDNIRDFDYVGTVQIYTGNLVFHVFQRELGPRLDIMD